MRLIFDFDPLCGWCYGHVPAMQAVAAAFPELPVHLALPGLVTGPRIGPYAAMEGYIRGASQRLRAVTGRAPSAAFFQLITTPGVIGQSGPPCLVLAAARAADPSRAVALAHLVIEAHFRDGADLNDPATYPPLMAQAGLVFDLPPLAPDPAALWRAEADPDITSFPTLVWQGPEGARTVLPTLYDPAALVDQIGRAIAGQGGLRYA